MPQGHVPRSHIISARTGRSMLDRWPQLGERYSKNSAGVAGVTRMRYKARPETFPHTMSDDGKAAVHAWPRQTLYHKPVCWFYAPTSQDIANHERMQHHSSTIHALTVNTSNRGCCLRRLGSEPIQAHLGILVVKTVTLFFVQTSGPHSATFNGHTGA